ncbi:hypothetical protein AMATHDRAFT_146334 [Amanita thiersii Skay4041]|uniref:Protein HRI1 n=1 Tax=Amanita thiersii Skay4041 TaxID=703135 RepID=A0A2A9NIV2_9AGAR|nr:hypothetical protein AMATHDRAFT_146334 [Amanita thiersii Skay4041]
MPLYVSHRKSIRWPPADPSEPTDTIVLTGETGVFVDVRIVKGSNALDWAIAGYRTQTGTNTVKFTHLIDSRSENTDGLEEHCTNTVLSDGSVLEVGEMVNPETGKVAPYEEVWLDEEQKQTVTRWSAVTRAIFIRDVDNRTWQGRVGDWQLGLGRNGDGTFWAWQAVKGNGVEGEWRVVRETKVKDEKRGGIIPEIYYGDWKEGQIIEWQSRSWVVLELRC